MHATSGYPYDDRRQPGSRRPRHCGQSTHRRCGYLNLVGLKTRAPPVDLGDPDVTAVIDDYPGPQRTFALASPAWTGLAALVMILFAGREAMARQDRRFLGFWDYGLGTTAMLISAVLVTVFALTTQIRPDPWFDPRYAIPILGMILGNTKSGVSLGLQGLSSSAWTERRGIEAQLALGANRWEAMRGVGRKAMMTGQILAGVDPVEAVKYQILIMFLIAGGTGFGSVVAVYGGIARLTDARHRLRLDRLAPAKN